MKKRRRQEAQTVREICRKIFGNEPPVSQVWEAEFDYADVELRAMAATEWQHITGRQLSGYYVLNLVYHEPMQPQLFRYLFPLCLAEWHETILTRGYGDHFEASFLQALRRPYLWRVMMDASQRQQVRMFLIDTILTRMDNERDFDPAMTWLITLNDLGGTGPLIRGIWFRWWALDSPGKAVCALQYAALLIYPLEDNPLWPEKWRPLKHPLGDSEAWLAENLAFLREVLMPERLLAGVHAAVEKLRGEQEEDIATRIAQDALDARDIIEIQIEDVLAELSAGR